MTRDHGPREVIVRPAIPVDAANLPNLLLELGYQASVEQLRSRLEIFAASELEAVFLAESTGQIVGCLHVGGRSSLVSEPKAEIHVLVVTESWRGHGVGKALIDQASKWAKDRGYNRLRLGTRVQREGAHAFYEKLGFELVKKHRIYEREVTR